MFSLIIVLIAIVLVAAIAVATVYYGGDVFSSGSANAEAATLLAQSAQIASASAAYAAENHGQKPTSLGELLDSNYLSSVPMGWAGDGAQISAKVIESANACEIFNAKQGLEGIPQCDGTGTPALPNPLTNPICCQ